MHLRAHKKFPNRAKQFLRLIVLLSSSLQITYNILCMQLLYIDITKLTTATIMKIYA